jgi:hypothetical protein
VAAADEAHYRRLLEAAVEANMNTVRVALTNNARTRRKCALFAIQPVGQVRTDSSSEHRCAQCL